MFNTSNIIQKLMIDKKKTQVEVSRKIGVSAPNLSAKLRNEKEEYKIEYLSKIAVACGCRIEVNIIDSESDKILYTLTDEENN